MSFGPFPGEFLAHSTSMNPRIRRKMISNDPSKSIHHPCTSHSETGRLRYPCRSLENAAAHQRMTCDRSDARGEDGRRAETIAGGGPAPRGLQSLPATAVARGLRCQRPPGPRGRRPGDCRNSIRSHHLFLHVARDGVSRLSRRGPRLRSTLPLDPAVGGGRSDGAFPGCAVHRQGPQPSRLLRGSGSGAGESGATRPSAGSGIWARWCR